MLNYFEVLGIEITNDEKEIKKAYARLIRKYSPENSPEKFSEISKAYKVLSNAEYRERYIKELKLGKSFEVLINEFEDAILDENLNLAEKLYIQLEEIDINCEDLEKLYPRLLELRGKYSEAISRYNVLQRKYPDEARGFITRKIKCLIELEEMDLAKASIISLYKLYNIINVTFSEFIYKNNELKNYYMNFNLIDELESHIKNDIDDFSILQWFKVYTILVSKENKYNLDIEAEKLMRYLKNSNRNFDFIIEEIDDVLESLEKNYRVKEQMIILKNLEEHLSEEIDYETVRIYKLISNVCNELDKILDDDKINKSLVLVTYANIYEKSLKEENKYKEWIDDSKERIGYLLENCPSEIIKDIAIIKAEYKNIYQYSKEYFDKILEFAKENQIENNSTTNTNTYQSSTSNTYNNSSNSNNSSDNSGCIGFVLIAGFVGGLTYIGGPIGFLIAIYIISKF